ncbi:MAG: hypothetical protein IIY94_04590 [Oscillospiraceae bacterium]|nr:hypothetical protein [Oscillospiraceae bacterium]
MMKQDYKTIYKVICVLCCLLVFFRGFLSEHIGFYRVNLSPHITNFSFTVVICLLAGKYMVAQKKKLVLLCCIMAALNLLCETVISGALNTPDLMDGVFGIAGAAVALLILLCTNRFGLAAEPTELPAVQRKEEGD